MTPPQRPFSLVGVDGGASGVRAVAATIAGGRVRALAPAVEEDYPREEPFEPVPLDEQRLQERAPVVASSERAQGEAWVAAAARCIARAAELAGCPERALVGVALPGVKTADGRGTRLVRNGPRIPDYLARLEERLGSLGCAPARPLGPLESDGVSAALGELRADGGALAGVACGYYLGGGSGLAESVVLDGEALGLEELGEGFRRAWELPSRSAGESCEDLVAPGPVNARWRARCGHLDARSYPEEHLDADLSAAAALTEMALELARLVHLRLAALTARGLHPQRVVVGQRLGQLWKDPRAASFLPGTAARQLARLLFLDPDERLARRHLVPAAGAAWGALAPGLLVGSSLRAAPALGAAWRAAGGGDLP